MLRVRRGPSNASRLKSRSSSNPYVIDFMGYDVFCRSGFIRENSRMSEKLRG